MTNCCVLSVVLHIFQPLNSSWYSSKQYSKCASNKGVTGSTVITDNVGTVYYISHVYCRCPLTFFCKKRKWCEKTWKHRLKHFFHCQGWIVFEYRSGINQNERKLKYMHHVKMITLFCFNMKNVASVSPILFFPPSTTREEKEALKEKS